MSVHDGEVAIREATVEDLSHVLRHRRGMFRDMGHRDEAQLDAMETVAAPFFAEGLRAGTYRGYFAVSAPGQVLAGGGVVFLEYQPHPLDPRVRRPFVVNMYTEPEHRRCGLARRLLVEMIEGCRRDGYRSLYLHASDEGRPLYAAMGFEPTNEMHLRL